MNERKTRVDTALGGDELLLESFEGDEALSQPFLYTVSLLREMGATLDPSKLLGTPLSVAREVPTSNDESGRGKPLRYFHGYVTRLTETGKYIDHVDGEDHAWVNYRLYQAEVRPWLWMLSRSSNCRVFQNMTVPDILQKVFSKYGEIAKYRLALSSYYKPREYCVQYCETDLAFVQRLLEHEGIYYYFKHEKTRHTLVLADAASMHEPIPSYGSIELALDDAGHDDTLGERIQVWRPVQQLRSGHYALKDYDFEDPKLKLDVRLKAAKDHKQSSFEQFEFPGDYQKTEVGDRYARIRLQEEQALYDFVEGEGNSHGLAPGFNFSLTEHPDASQNQDYLTTSAHYEFSLHDYEGNENAKRRPFTCKFKAVKKSTQFRPERVTPWPSISGLQSAKVVGPGSEDIWTDRYGRVKVQFSWDREGTFNDKSSCWIRVAQIWAGKSWGGQYVPRIGHEVVVSFLDGNPDKPLIVGSVYNAVNKPPFNLPDDAQISGFKTDSTKSSQGGYNQLSFDDKDGQELILIHAQKNMRTSVEEHSELKAKKKVTIEAGTRLVIQAGVELELQVGAAKVVLSAAGIAITGAVNITGATSIKGATTITGMTTLTGGTTITGATLINGKPPLL